MQDLDINRVSFEEIVEFHDLNMDDLQDGQYNIVAVVTGGSTEYVPNPVGSGGGGSTVPPLSAVTAVGNHTTGGIIVDGDSTFINIILSSAQFNDMRLEDNNITSQNALNMNAYYGISMNSFSGNTLNVIGEISSSSLKINGNSEFIGRAISSRIPTADDDLINLKYLTDNYSRGDFLDVNGTNYMKANLKLNGYALILNGEQQQGGYEMHIRGIEGQQESYIEIKGDVKINGTISAIESSISTDLATVNYVDTAISSIGEGFDPNALPKAGGAMSGPIEMSTNEVVFGFNKDHTYRAFISGKGVAPGRSELTIEASGGIKMNGTVEVQNSIRERGRKVVTSETAGGTGEVTRIWSGSQAQYDVIVQSDDDEIYTLYIII